jgi:protein-tyrosine-phosphatase
MKKVLFVSMRGIGKRTEFAKQHFDKVNELSAKWMMSVHGCGRWPSSRTPMGLTEMTTTVTPEECDWADYIILMDTNPPDWRDRVMYSEKIQHWYIEKGLPWEEQTKLLRAFVATLADQCDSWRNPST